MNVSWCPKNTRLNANDTKVIAKIVVGFFIGSALIDDKCLEEKRFGRLPQQRLVGMTKRGKAVLIRCHKGSDFKLLLPPTTDMLHLG